MSNLFRYRRVGNRWSDSRWGTAENPIVGRRHMWQSVVFAIAPRNSNRAQELKPGQPLPPGRYLLKIFIDRRDKTKKNRDYELGESEFYGQVEIHGNWKVGYQPPKIVHAPARD